MNSRILIFIVMAMIALAGCDSPKKETSAQKDSSPPQAIKKDLKTEKLFTTPVKTTLVEAATAALPVWRNYSANRPTLILFSNEPFLTPIPEKLKKDILELVINGDPEQIKIKGVDITSNPLLMHGMAVDAALNAGLFSELVWVIPAPQDTSLPPLEKFRQKLMDARLISQKEADSLTAQGNQYVGTWRGIPVTIASLSFLPKTSNPAFVHFDLGFFKPLYKNEVSTPLYPLIFNTLKKIRSAEFNTIDSTISHSNLGGAISLKVRFIGQDLAYLINHPKSLDEELPELQFRRSQNLYLEQFIKKTEILENCLKMEKSSPNNASVKFDTYLAHRELQHGKLALESLEQAVALDPMYAYEYIFLAETAMEKKHPEAALRMLTQARKTFPDNPTLMIMEANIQIMIGHRDPALELIKQLQELPWSEIYDSEMPNKLKQMNETANKITTHG